jgi:hypothetical protein
MAARLRAGRFAALLLRAALLLALSALSFATLATFLARQW